ncbi:hypothetical protein N7476_010382 [Penicillium atrosanguineum]|uniref:Major facilitator superfamily (MFS) profile domain-containing protein n=1 Tax=Penicillium atrosanguineum TaxID=1132637 RepID=A0A9W9U194_9EURO|nr:hypothetical protein N7526_007447 [Penicillium atrosanguineum]KAJ5303583.1 hypothetical protein N7476_010382 [Penicillium atrosanguineum]
MASVHQKLRDFVKYFSTNSSSTDQVVDTSLNPTPTDSPNDPLNWSLGRKYWHSFLVLFIVGLTAATSNDISPAQYGMNDELGISWGSMNTSSGILFLAIGYGTLLFSPIPALYGRRVIYIVCLLLSIIGSVWLACTQNTQSALWNQLFVGASESCAEATAQLSLSDLFFQHQRGSVLGLYILATSMGTYLGPLIAGIIADKLGWRWIGWLGTILSVATLIVFFLGFEETSFDRTPQITISSRADDSLAEVLSPKEESADIPKFSGETPTSKNTGHDIEHGSWHQTSRTWKAYLFPPAPNVKGTGTKQYFKLLFHNMKVFALPAVWYSGLQWGAQDAWLTFYMTIEEDNWVESPWNYSQVSAALMNVPTLIGAIIGCLYGGYFSDIFVHWMAKRNNGTYEAEHRLWLVLPAGVVSPIGLLILGLGTDQGWKWTWPYIGLGMIGFGWGCAGDLSMAYLEDAYPEIILEGMVGVSVINNTLGCIFSFVCQSWLDVQSVTHVFVEICIISFVIMVMTTVLMLYWGKRMRKSTENRYRNFLVVRDAIL